jgi:hypothetical protein
MMDKNGNGNVTDAQIADQIRVVNQTFGGQEAVGTAANTGITFTLAGTDSLRNSTWHADRQSATYRTQNPQGRGERGERCPEGRDSRPAGPVQRRPVVADADDVDRLSRLSDHAGRRHGGSIPPGTRHRTSAAPGGGAHQAPTDGGRDAAVAEPHLDQVVEHLPVRRGGAQACVEDPAVAGQAGGECGVA